MHPQGGVQVTPARGLVEPGGSVNLTCMTQAGPMNMFEWIHTPTNTQLAATFMDEMQSVLNIGNASTEDQGEYACNATNSAGSYVASGIVVGESLYGTEWKRGM